MKLLLALTVLFASQAQAASTTNCTGNQKRNQLSITTVQTRIGLGVHATLTEFDGTIVKLYGLQSFDNQPAGDVYTLNDPAGQPAELKIYYRTRPCGRGSCDPDALPKKLAQLTYLGATQTFSCHETASL